MAIKQLSYDKGEELQIRKNAKVVRIPPNEILEKIEENIKDERRLIIKCGKSFWDVTAAPDIFEISEEFNPDELTSIDLKQMGKQEPPKPAFEEESKENPLSELYHRTDEEDEDEEPEQFERKTYYIRAKDVEAITIVQHLTRVQVSAIVREALERGLTSIANEFGYDNLYDEAEKSLAQKGFTGKKRSFKNIIK